MRNILISKPDRLKKKNRKDERKKGRKEGRKEENDMKYIS
jgi:hypothetical protein